VTQQSARDKAFLEAIVELRRNIAVSMLRKNHIPTSQRLISQLPRDRSLEQIYDICAMHYERSLRYKIGFFKRKVISKLYNLVHRDDEQ